MAETTNPINLYTTPELHAPHLVAAWSGMGAVALLAANYLRQALEVELFGEIDPHSYYSPAQVIIQDGVILASHYAPASPYATGFIISPDMGRTWAQYDLKELGRRSPVRFSRKNGDGWFRVDLRTGWIKRDGVLFIKPKPR